MRELVDCVPSSMETISNPLLLAASVSVVGLFNDILYLPSDSTAEYCLI